MRASSSVGWLVLVPTVLGSTVAQAQEPPAAPERKTLLVVAFAGADADLVKQTAERLGKALGVAVEVLDARPEPDEAGARDGKADLPRLAQQLGLESGGTPEELEKRIRAALKQDKRPEAKQALVIVDELVRKRLSPARLEAQVAGAAGERLRQAGVVGALGVTDRDLAPPDLNFVFGHGDRKLKAGVISSIRFSQGAKPPQLVKRLVVQALSTTGFLLGLDRCQEASCARAFPRSLDEHDKKQEGYCAACKPTVTRALGR